MTFLEATRSKYGPVLGVGRGVSATAAPVRMALSTDPEGDAVAEVLAGEPLPSSRWADDTENKDILIVLCFSFKHLPLLQSVSIQKTRRRNVTI